MKKPFEVGQKIKFVGPTWKYIPGVVSANSWEHTPQLGIITDVKADRLMVRAFDDKSLMIHPIQVTHRIVKKKRREWYLNFYLNREPTVHPTKEFADSHPGSRCECIHVVEVRK